MGDTVSFAVVGSDVEVSLVTVSGVKFNVLGHGKAQDMNGSIPFMFGKYHRRRTVAQNVCRIT
tara:strand:- start:380 stop:568 length:189 start_codon:yes stop_codon:yes gene_type:complete